MTHRVHVFVGTFGSRAQATAYSEEQWRPEPGPGASELDWRIYEDDNPYWQMREELGVAYLDGDFVETIAGDDRWAYLGGLLVEPGLAERLRAEAGPEDTLVLIFEQALGDFAGTLRDTPMMRYLGSHPCRLG